MNKKYAKGLERISRKFEGMHKELEKVTFDEYFPQQFRRVGE
jgi:hypothetical protein